jgi:DNA-binding SARP family transcriptional activator
MDSLFSSEPGAFASLSDAPSLGFLLERGLENLQCGRYNEGVAILALAREQLAPNQNDLATALDTFLQKYAGYQLVQQTLLEASMHFAQAYTEQQACVNVLLGMLPTLIRGITSFDYLPNPQPGTNNTQPPPFPSHSSPMRFSTFFSIQSSEEALLSHATLAEDDALLPALSVTCFGRFEVRRLGRSVTLCSNRSGQAILRYLVAKPGHTASSDILQTLCWSEDESEVAQRKLHIAISALRRSLHDGSPPDPRASYILCKNGTYSLNPVVAIHTDVEEFLYHYQTGKQMSEDQEKQVASYEQACALYKGPFLPEDTYADWSFQQREQLVQTYLTICGMLTDHYLKIKRYEDAARTAQTILKESRCDEAAHQQLIRIYAAQGRRSEALQQYHRCARLLREELNVQPLHETELLFQQLLTNESPQNQK